MKNGQKYILTLDTTAKVISAAFIVAIIVLMLVYIVMVTFLNRPFEINEENLPFLFALNSLLLLLLLLPCYLYAPLSYELTDTQLLISRPIGTLSFPYKEMNKITPMEKWGGITSFIRLFGVGGLFGYYGLMYSRTEGRFGAYLSALKPIIFIQLKNEKKIAVNLVHPDFLNQLTEKVNPSK